MAGMLKIYRDQVQRIPKGADLLWHRMAGLIFRSLHRPKYFLQQADAVLERERFYSGLLDSELRKRCQEIRPSFRSRQETGDIRVEALALIREASRRIRREHPYREQIAASLAILSGCIAELATGEGKTLSAALAGILEGWRGHGCHIVTVNDYLARRDAEAMDELYQFCGIRVAFLVEETPDDRRRNAYKADVLYATNKTLAADFLRDQLRRETGRQRSAVFDEAFGLECEEKSPLMRNLYCAFVDEVDSILIDEAVTPLILSGPSQNKELEETFLQAKELADRLEAGSDYRVINHERDIILTESGTSRLAAWSDAIKGVFASYRRTRELVIQSLIAKHFYQVGKQYVVQDGKVVIVDEFTGRLMPDREWRDGLHQAVSAREGAVVTASKETLSRISFQRFFRMYRKLGGMTGTASEAHQEFWDVYTLPVVRIPTHRPCIREHPAPKVFDRAQDKTQDIIHTIISAHNQGRAVLVGTRSVRASIELSRLLTSEELPHDLLNAERHEEEANIVRNAGCQGRITVATNMAGRGTDIRLDSFVKTAGGLLVILTERHESRRVDFQLFGRCARQGDPGTAEEIFCLEDEIFQKYFWWLNWFFRGKGELCGLRSLLALRLFAFSQWAAQRGARISRRQLASLDEALCDSLGFAGREFYPNS